MPGGSTHSCCRRRLLGPALLQLTGWGGRCPPQRRLTLRLADPLPRRVAGQVRSGSRARLAGQRRLAEEGPQHRGVRPAASAGPAKTTSPRATAMTWSATSRPTSAFCSTMRIPMPVGHRAHVREDPVGDRRRQPHGRLVQEHDLGLGHPSARPKASICAPRRAARRRCCGRRGWGTSPPRQACARMPPCRLCRRRLQFSKTVMGARTRRPSGTSETPCRTILCAGWPIDPVEHDGARRGRVQAGDGPQGGRLAGAVGPQQQGDPARVDAQAQATRPRSGRSRHTGR